MRNIHVSAHAALALSLALAFGAPALGQPQGPTSKVIIIGGESPGLRGDPTTEAGRTATLFDSATNSFTDDQSMHNGRHHFCSALLADGRVLAAGGEEVFAPLGAQALHNQLNAAEIWDPTSGGLWFTQTPMPMHSERGYCACARLPSGDVLIVGGRKINGEVLNSAELFHPASNTFTPLSATMSQSRRQPTATLLRSGKVLIAGGLGSGALDTAELFDPVSQTFHQPGGPHHTMWAHRALHTATPLVDGTVLLTGGIDENGASLASAEIYDPASDNFLQVAAMNIPRREHTATLLANGSVLIAGGAGNSVNHPPAELFDPRSRTFSPSAVLNPARFGHAAARLADGRVLITGGVFFDQLDIEQYPTSTALFDGQSFVPGPEMTPARFYHEAVALPPPTPCQLLQQQINALRTLIAAEFIALGTLPERLRRAFRAQIARDQRRLEDLVAQARRIHCPV
jgi:hypothetical protein